jgi:hypothetical protein
LDPILEIQGLSSQAKKVQKDLNAFETHVSNFAAWWITINGNLKSLQDVIPQIKPDGTNPIRTLTVNERWTEVRTKYQEYSVEVSLSCTST